jgi:hypothetical protein
MRRTRHVLAAVVVATALCADRAVAAAPQHGPQVSLARSLATKLTTSFRQAVPVVRFLPSRLEGTEPAPRPAVVMETAALVHASQSSPFRFRLPPPTL